MSMDGSWVAGNYAVLNPSFDYGLFPFPTTKGNGCLNMEPNATLFKPSASRLRIYSAIRSLFRPTVST